MFISSGVLVAGFLDAYDIVGYSIFWLLLPMTAIFISAVIVNDKILISRLLLKNRLGGYCLAVFGVVYVLTLLSLLLEYVTRSTLGLPMRIANYLSPWILADTLGNGLLLAMILLGLGLLHLFNRWQQEVENETLLTRKLQSYISSVKDRLNPTLILDKLNEIVADGRACPKDMETRIRHLSVYLREQLYELPEPPKIKPIAVENERHSRITSLLVSRKFRYARHMVFLVILMIISCGAFFNAPDNPKFTFDRFLGVLSMFGVLALIAYINILWLYPHFMKSGNVKKYTVAVMVMLLAIIIPVILLQILTYEPNVYSKQLPFVITFISTMGSLLTLFLFIGGISVLLLLQNWIGTKQRLTLLKAETIRQEYSYLRKQINPHFLFNVLNNIGISVYDDPDYAKRLIKDLMALLKYQLEDMGRDKTSLSNELAFIRSYFALEATRRDSFDYDIEVDIENQDEDITIPTLLFIPFFENAVKYSVASESMPEVRIKFEVRKRWLRFLCTNPYDAEDLKHIQKGGIGLTNTRRRLELLYEGNYTLRCEKGANTFSVILEIPLQ